jgi:demethylspheroidene O-methyltransferase
LHVALPDNWLRFRDRLLASTRFQQWALRFPLTKWIARRRAAALFDICAGFVYSQVLLACVRLRLFERLRAGPRSLSGLESELGLTRDALLTLLNAAAALELVRWCEDGEQCGLGQQGAALLGNPGLLPLIEHHALFYRDLQDPVALLRQGGGAPNLGSYWSYARADTPAAASAQQVDNYTALMSASQSLISSEILGAYDLTRHRILLDVGGGDGTFSMAAAKAAPGLQIRCFDLPAVAERARMRFAAADIGSRAEAFGGSFLSDPLPTGCDVISLVRVLHDHNDADALRILQAVRRAIAPDGTLLIAEPLAGTPGGERVAEAYFGFYLLAMGSGKPRNFCAVSDLLATAGFTRPTVRSTRLPMNVRVLVAKPLSH